MKNVSFWKEEDCPIPKKNTKDFNDDELDLDDDNSFAKGNKNESSNKKEKSSKEQYKEYKLNPNEPKNKKVIFPSENEDNDSDKSSEENENDKEKK